METKRQELEARIAELRKRVNLLEGCYTRSYSKANENAKAKHKARIQRLCTDLGFPSTAGQWTAHTALAAAERELEALDAPGRFCGSCLYYDEPGRCVCFNETQADFDPACADWVARIKPEQEAQ